MTKSTTRIIVILGNHFGGDSDKVWAWLNKPNRNLGDIIPHHLIVNDREEIVLSYVEGQKDLTDL